MTVMLLAHYRTQIPERFGRNSPWRDLGVALPIGQVFDLLLYLPKPDRGVDLVIRLTPIPSRSHLIVD